VPLGIVAGVIGGRMEMLIMRSSDMLMAFPTLLLALIIVTALGGSLANEMLAIGVALTPNFVRLARSLALTIREQDYILAARALGGGQLRVMARHVFPNASLRAGRGGHPLHRHRHSHRGEPVLPRARHPAAHAELGQHPQRGPPVHQVLPVADDVLGLAIMAAVLAFNLMGDALRDLLDPRLKASSATTSAGARGGR